MSELRVLDGTGADKYLKTTGAGTVLQPHQTVVKMESADSASIDAFARLRVSNVETIFDSKQIFDKQPLFWDDQEVSGSGTTSVWAKASASTTIGVAASTAGKRVRQTFMRFNYYPGKSQLIFMTSFLDASGGGSGIKRLMGQFDDENGVFFRDNEGTLEAVIRSSKTGSPVDNAIAQSSWNLDTMDGNGESGYNIDTTKSQIIFFDYEWLGVGRVRMGFVVDGVPIYCHQFLHSNVTSGVYMSTPNNPLRYEIENTGAGAASTMEHICSTIMTEGGSTHLGLVNYESTSGVHIDANTADQLYAVIGVRLKSTHLGATIKPLTTSLLAETADGFEWVLVVNPTVAGTFTYVDKSNSALQTVLGDTTNTVTGGQEIRGGFVSTSSSTGGASISGARLLGSAIDGTPDEVVLCVRPLGVNADIQASISWRELT